ncbi:6327_t:CDS:2, partial [Scutellospora calospora]
DAIDTMSRLGYTVCAKMVENFRKKIRDEHVKKTEEHFIKHKDCFHIYNIDDYYAIHEIQRPDTVTTSDTKHFVTCVAKPVLGSRSVLLVNN